MTRLTWLAFLCRQRSSIRKHVPSKRGDGANRAGQRASFAAGTAISSFKSFDDDDEEIYEFDDVTTARSPMTGSTRFSEAHVRNFDARSQTRASSRLSEWSESLDTAAASRHDGRGGEGADVVRNARMQYNQPGLGRDNLRSTTASNVRGMVEDLAYLESDVARLLKDRGKEINPRNGRIGTAKWLKRPEPKTNKLAVTQLHEDAAVLKLVFSPDGHRLITVGKNGVCKVMKSTMEDVSSKPGGGLPANIDAETELWEQEQEVRGHPLGCWSAAVESTKAAFFVVTGRDNYIRVFGEGVLHGPVNDDVAPLSGLCSQTQNPLWHPVQSK